MSQSKKSFTFHILQFLVTALIYLSLIFNDNVWMDEAFSAVLAKGTFSEVLSRSAADTLPPLYNILNFIMLQIFGEHTWALKLVSVLSMAGCGLLAAFLISRYMNSRISLLYTLCLCGMPQLLYYGVEIRMYALGLFFVTAVGICALMLFSFSDSDYKNKFFTPVRSAFIIASAGAGYTHHFAFVTVGFIHLYLLIDGICHIKKSSTFFKYQLTSTLITGLIYLPCLFTTIKQAKRVTGYFSMPDISASYILSCLKMPFITNNTPLSLLLMLIFTAAVVSGIYLFFNRKSKNSLVGLLLVSLYPMTLLFGALATVVLKSNIFTDRYLVPSLGLVWLGFCIIFIECIDSLSKISVRAALYFALLLFMLAVVVQDYRTQFSMEYAPGVKSMISYFDKNFEEGDGYIIYEDNYQIEICLRYYCPDFKIYNKDNLNTCPGKLYYLQVPGFEDKEKEITSLGYVPQKVGDFSFDRYSFTLYEL